MTIKHHIILSATITLALIAIIACQSKTQAPETKKQNKSVSKVATVVEKSTKEAENIATEKIEKAIDESSTKIEENVQDVEEEVKEAVDATEAEVEKTEAKVNEVESNVEYSVKPEAINLFVNGAFNDGLKGWNYDKNVAVIEEDGQKTIELTGSASEQTRIWQRVSTISGHVYRLSFKLKADQSGALAILRDNAKEEESYFFTGESKDWKVFKKDFKSIKNGEYLLFLSCKAEGKFYYSSASFIDVTKE